MENKSKIALIATVQKSGTWYTNNVMRCLEILLNQPELSNKKDELRNIIKQELADGTVFEKSKHSSRFGLDDFFICHTICPGFEDFFSQNDTNLDKWQATQFHLWGYNWGETFIRHQQKWELLIPQKNPEARIIYLYRNPLDHLVSFYFHAMNHQDKSHRFMLATDGVTEIPINNLQEFIFKAGALGSYLKHYYTFYQMQQYFPKQIKLVSYENLVANPGLIFPEIFNFLRMDTIKSEWLSIALDICSKSSMQAIENELNHSMVKDQLGEGKHIRNGNSNLWMDKLNNEELQEIEAVFNAFSFSLKQFIGDLTFSNSTEKEKLIYQNKFFDHQAWLAKNMKQMIIPDWVL